jgi:hypothetical protein
LVDLVEDRGKPHHRLVGIVGVVDHHAVLKAILVGKVDLVALRQGVEDLSTLLIGVFAPQEERVSDQRALSLRRFGIPA